MIDRKAFPRFSLDVRGWTLRINVGSERRKIGEIGRRVGEGLLAEYVLEDVFEDLPTFTLYAGPELLRGWGMRGPIHWLLSVTWGLRDVVAEGEYLHTRGFEIRWTWSFSFERRRP